MRRTRSARFYGAASDRPAVEWRWVHDQLETAGTYWVVGPTSGHPHPRPVWGIWADDRLHLSVGSPALSSGLTAGTPVTVHLDSGTDVVIVEGTRGNPADTRSAPALLAAYERKYDWHYDTAGYGPLVTIEPSKVLAWRSAGWAGRDGFQVAGCWVFDGAVGA